MTNHPHRARRGVYRISVDPQVYAGTYGYRSGRWCAPDGTDEWPTRAAAVTALCEAVGAERDDGSLYLDRHSDGTYYTPGDYVTGHGQYGRPVYRIRRV